METSFSPGEGLLLADERYCALQTALFNRFGVRSTDTREYTLTHYPTLAPLLDGLRCEDTETMKKLGITCR